MPPKKSNSLHSNTTLPEEGTEEYTNWLFKNYTKDNFLKKYITPQILSEYGLLEDACKKDNYSLASELTDYALKCKNVDFSVVASEALWACVTHRSTNTYLYSSLMTKLLNLNADLDLLQYYYECEDEKYTKTYNYGYFLEAFSKSTRLNEIHKLDITKWILNTNIIDILISIKIKCNNLKINLDFNYTNKPANLNDEFIQNDEFIGRCLNDKIMIHLIKRNAKSTIYSFLYLNNTSSKNEIFVNSKNVYLVTNFYRTVIICLSDRIHYNTDIEGYNILNKYFCVKFENDEIEALFVEEILNQTPYLFSQYENIFNDFIEERVRYMNIKDSIKYYTNNIIKNHLRIVAEYGMKLKKNVKTIFNENKILYKDVENIILDYLW